MDIRDWQMDRIMQLPDWCFGRKWWTGVNVTTTDAGAGYYLFEEQLPDKFVIWDVLVAICGYTAATRAALTIRLCDRLPTGALLPSFEKLLKGIATETATYEFFTRPVVIKNLGPMRCMVESKGRRIGGSLLLTAGSGTNTHTVSVLISSIPREVPDWLVLVKGKKQ